MPDVVPPAVPPERVLIENVVGDWIQEFDEKQLMRADDFQDILITVTDKVYKVLVRDGRPEMDDEDRDFIERRVHRMVRDCLERYDAEARKQLRFRRTERVVCRMGGARPWASGNIQAVNEDDPQDETGRTKLPYVVKVDPPLNRLISVPKDDYDICRAEVCFGTRAGALWFTLYCMPWNPPRGARRFAVGDRVACAVEDESNDYSVWASGTVLDVDYDISADAAEMMRDRDWAKGKGVVPYRVQLDEGGTVLVHRDQHWLVRDLALQAARARQSTEGRCLTRIEKRNRGDNTWEAIDHQTRRVRSCDPISDDEDEGAQMLTQ